MYSTQVNFNELTTAQLNGGGLFDIMMRSVKEHLEEEYASQRIRGPEYAKVYLGSMEAVLTNTVQYLISGALLEEQRLKLQAERELVQAQIEKLHYEIQHLLPLEYAKLDLLNKKTDAELKLIEAQVIKVKEEVVALDWQNKKTAGELKLIDAQIEKIQYENIALEWAAKAAEYKYVHSMPVELEKLKQETEFIKNKNKSEIAQINDVVDGVQIAGLMGGQLKLLEQQRQGFIRDAEQKAAKILADAWSVQKSVDEGVPVPDGLQNDEILAVMTKLLQGIQAR